MPKTPLPESPTELTDEPVLEDSFYEVPAELQDEPLGTPRGHPPAESEDEPPVFARRFPTWKVALAVGLLVLAGAGLMVFRAQARRNAVRKGIEDAERIMRLDTAAAYRQAADLLAPHAQLDPLEAGSARAFALAMLAADYRDTRAEAEANALLVVPGRSETIPVRAALAFSALALGKNVLGDATAALGAAAGSPWAGMLQARIALRAGTLDAAIEPATAAAAENGFAAGLAVHGDAMRRARRDGRSSRAAYEAALAASPAHPRAAFGLAKLALSGDAPEGEARDALSRVLESGAATPAPERGRAALHLAALRLRAGEPREVVCKELCAGLGERTADWLMGAARAEAANHGPYRAVSGAPRALESASDDDPPDLRPMAAEPPPPGGGNDGVMGRRTAPPFSKSSRSPALGRGGFLLGWRLRLDRAGILALGLFVAVDELDHRHRRVVAVAEAGLDDAQVTAVAILVARRQHIEELLGLLDVAQLADRLAAQGEAAALTEGHELLDDRPQFLGLGQRGDDLLVLDQSR